MNINPRSASPNAALFTLEELDGREPVSRSVRTVPMSETSARKLVTVLRQNAATHRGNADSALRAINALMEQYDQCTDAERRSALADSLDTQSKRYADFIATARRDERMAREIEASLVAPVAMAAE